MDGLAGRTIDTPGQKCKCYTKVSDFPGSDARRRRPGVIVEIEPAAPESVAAELLAIPFSGTQSVAFRHVDERLRGRLAALLSEADPEAGKTAVLDVFDAAGVAARRVALVGVGSGDAFDADSVRS